MKVLVTGAKGFIGKNLCWWLRNTGHEVIQFDVEDKLEDLAGKLNDVGFIVHLAGVNRPTNPEEFYSGNYGFTRKLVEVVMQSGYDIPIIYSSSSQALLDNDYGKSKKMAEEYLMGCPLSTYVYRLDNVFGPGCRPNYNSFVSTMANNIANDLPYKIDDRQKKLTLLNVFKICDEFERIISGTTERDEMGILTIPGVEVKLGYVEELLKLFNKHPYQFPLKQDSFMNDLYLAYISYRPDFINPLVEHSDERGCFIELMKSPEQGQVSINVSRPGVTKGGHYHTRKIEDFMTIFGDTVTRLRKPDSVEIKEYKSSGEKPSIVHIVPPYTHDITNVGSGVSLTLMWINEVYDDKDPDTYRQDVII